MQILKTKFTIVEVAKLLDMNDSSNLRYHIRVGNVPAPTRGTSTRKYYSPEDVESIIKILQPEEAK